MPAIISAAEVTDAEAIHPGYGFLSRTPTSPSAWKRAASVHRPDARVHPHHGRQGVGQAGHDQGRRALRARLGGELPDDPVQIRRIAKAIGYPVIIKAAGGGGGAACAWCTPRRR
jgi:acetyl-CoA carboxylase biotin carboxylase subunit